MIRLAHFPGRAMVLALLAAALLFAGCKKEDEPNDFQGMALFLILGSAAADPPLCTETNYLALTGSQQELKFKQFSAGQARAWAGGTLTAGQTVRLSTSYTSASSISYSAYSGPSCPADSRLSALIGQTVSEVVSSGGFTSSQSDISVNKTGEYVLLFTKSSVIDAPTDVKIQRL